MATATATDNRDGRESARLGDMPEALSLRMVANGATVAVESPVEWKGATMEPFLTMERAGWRKHRARVEWNVGTRHARVVEIHFWLSPTGERAYLKIKD
jgi:hypothetical protein